MTVLGVSVYPDLRPMDEICEYLADASRYGFTRVFSSIFQVEGQNDEVLRSFGHLISSAHEHNMEVSLDVNPACMRRFGATPQDLGVFAKIGVDILRMDGAYDEDDNLRMLANPYNMCIEYNASSLDPQSIARLVERGASRDRIRACHNFYPQRYTGFTWKKYLAVNERLRAAGIRIGAFAASHASHTHGVWDAQCGLPTVEFMRDYPADLQARLLAAGGATDVLFGNAYATSEELAMVRQATQPVEPHYVSEAHKESVASLSSYLGSDPNLNVQHKVRVQPVNDLQDIERTILFDYFPHMDMGDSSEWIWRSRGAREFYRHERIEPRTHPLDHFDVGDVVMVNNNYRHYAGEVQVVLRPLANDGTRNLVARISPSEMHMFDVISDGDIVVFE